MQPSVQDTSSGPDQHVRTKRKGHKKTRTGCITCKIRRVKCDEAQPSCRRCLSTKRVCDGYRDTPAGPSSHLLPLASPSGPKPAPGPGTLPSASSAWTPAERRAFDFYMACSFPRLFSDATASFWGRIVPVLCLREPAVRHAVFAVSSLHETRFHGQRPGPQAKTPAFAADQYGRALRALRLWKDPAPGHPGTSAASALPLIACGLFVCVEFMMGNRAAAHTHIDQGRRVLAHYGRGSTARSAPAAELIRREIAPVFVRVSLASFLLGSSPEDIPETFRSTARTSGPTTFVSTADADQAMFDILDAGLRFAKASRSCRHNQARGVARADADADLKREQHRLLTHLDRWDKADAALCARTGSSADNLTRVYFHLSKIFIGMALELGDLCYDDYTAHFASIIIIVGRLLDAEEAAGAADPGRRCRFSFEMGMTPPVFFTAIKCRHPGLRRRAVELLRRRVAEGHQDNLWDSGQVIKAAARAIELEEMRGWTMVEPSSSVDGSENGAPLQVLSRGKVSTDWVPDVMAFDEDGRPIPENPTFVYELWPDPQPILRSGHGVHHNTEATWKPPAAPREFPKLARLFQAQPQEISPALAEEAWASLILSTWRLESRGLASASAAGAAWATECSVPTILQIPEAARIRNVTISPLNGTGSWIGFHVQPDPAGSRVGILNEYM